MTVQTDAPLFPKPIQWIARIISFLLHPLFVGIIIMGYLVFIHPTYFIAVPEKTRLFRFLTFVNNNVVLPLLVVLLLRGLGFSKSIYLRTQKERIAPYVASNVFFFWTWYVFLNQPDSPAIATAFCQGMFFSSCVALILNNFFKISMHGIAMGGMMGIMIVMVFSGNAYSAWPVVLTLLLTAAVASARKIISDHSWFDIIAGLLVGCLMQLLAWWV